MQKDILGDTAKLMEDFLPEHGTEEEFYNISSVNFITENFPSCFIMTCPGDFLYEAPEDLIPVLKKNKIPFIYRVYGNNENPLAHVFHCNINLEEAKLCNDEECNFFKTLL